MYIIMEFGGGGRSQCAPPPSVCNPEKGEGEREGVRVWGRKREEKGSEREMYMYVKGTT